ncbi:hypothetical protein [Halapricum hydrolyticum]|uniref:Uncharacterized protein n=1 Tax=Halapricum hydrolyticum TaxID=2979991 RepID=A0AAE3IAH9_9EURY|nr:hypothetical protein [Halapricum hydrolyticum]MCU4718380.1 hypothetical protein [Halapricum hydrolyticum]MCU4726507.1 hypothetical protein [Halapricum hydrolyticum]
MATNAFPGNSAHPTKDTPSYPKRDGRKTAQDDSSTGAGNSLDASQGEPPNHGLPTHGSARFLLWIGQRRDREDGFDPDLSDLPELFEQWQGDTSEQTMLVGWSE